ncbi:FtsX-like permease family protein [Reichenbachiella sp. MSK19-1]|uniref:ABC transporter permease n=1 Tax=Reichenbachiella sp. MSK19-1 TaxID=1897631 RepID=UPI000E6BE6AA|nr:FtsX-like permease family protein [Reichenbachiella sp. MSK19-1]RJE73015.1 hypothetical protein BGP76_03460 [Reichenbachiella sp. MSK19-1]
MRLPLFISRRYFFSKKKKNFINIIAIISMLVVAIGTAALIIVLSVFNGMEDLLRSIYGQFDTAMQVMPAQGKSFQYTDDLKFKINSIDGVMGITEVIEDNALLKYNNSEMVVKIKGLSEDFIEQGRMKNAIKHGEFALQDGKRPLAIVGRGIQFNLGISLRNEFTFMEFYYPKNVKPGSLNPSKYYSHAIISPGGVFALEQHYDDNYVFVPITFAEKLLDYQGKRTALEISIDSPESTARIQEALQASLGSDYIVRNADQQHEDLYKILKIEKLFVFIVFSLIVAIASINIFFSLSMLVTEKKADISLLFAMGATRSMIRKIFLTEGAIIAFIGSGCGLILGFSIAWLQESFGIISMGVESAVMQAYPIKIIASDFVYTSISIILITFLAGVQPSLRAASQSQFLRIK